MGAKSILLKYGRVVGNEGVSVGLLDRHQHVLFTSETYEGLLSTLDSDITNMLAVLRFEEESQANR